MKTSFGKPSEKGNVLVWILISVFFFAGLGFVMSQGSRTSTSGLSNEKVSTYARQIISYGNELKQSVKRLSLGGIGASEISFENPVVGIYTNANCTQESCKVFSAVGGGLNWISPSAGLNDGTEWLYTTNQIPGVGLGTESEIIALLQNIDLDICNRINSLSGFGPAGGPPPQESDVIDMAPFTGTYGAVVMDDGTYFPSALQGCFEGGGTPAAGTYHYFKVLLSR